MSKTSSEETLHSKEAYERLTSTHVSRLCAYSADNGRFVDSLFKESFQTCKQHINYCGVGSRHQNAIVGYRIKELILVSNTLLLHATILWPEAVSSMM